MSNGRVAWLTSDDPVDAFPPVSDALLEPDGLLAAGGDLSVERILFAYRNGIFPWYDDGQPLLWWSPDPRCVFLPGDFRVSRRLRQDVRKSTWTIRTNTAFGEVIRACAAPRRSQDGTWITPAITAAFEQLNRQNWAHSIEVWDGSQLVGGLYGLHIGDVFFGESMFSRDSNASKMALLYLARQLESGTLGLLDCQVTSSHLLSLGARTLPRSSFVEHLEEFCKSATPGRIGSDTSQPCSQLCRD